jgi:hypothetical protein
VIADPSVTVPDDAPTIDIEGITYRYVRDNDATTLAGREGPVYWLHGPRGALLFTMRNVPHPDRMFLVNGHGFTRKAPRTWLTDRDGTLAVLR